MKASRKPEKQGPGLQVGAGTVELLYHRRGSRTVVEVIANTAPLEVMQTPRWPWAQPPWSCRPGTSLAMAPSEAPTYPWRK